MAIPELSSLVTVDPRDVWAHEALSFTPWLLANEKELGSALAMDLSLTQAEFPVGGFSLDLIGRDIASDTVVIVENQLTGTDHTHLGQLLTYAAGTKAATIVWIATGFRDEHRAALDWLNTHTDPDTRFFGVVVSAVTLTGAPPGLVAPRFEVVAKPNDWDKKVHQSAQATGSISEKDGLYGKFWTAWMGDVAVSGWTQQAPPAKNFVYLPSGMSGTRYVVSFRTEGLLSELYLSDAAPAMNTTRLAALEARRADMEAAYGRQLVFDYLPGRKGCRVGEFLSGATIEDEQRWDEFRSFLTDAQTRLRAALKAIGWKEALSTVVPLEDIPAGTDGEDATGLDD